ncbi:hypothetical protein EDF36_1792 [Rathayibacter sp. PhB152]|uniref:hypothetical protein n=1 Tax=Rathayibacter sp. PhB152 TaxID=2485190 RepID=UPI000F4B77AB|nr:hypothetical protein [Rathayibacter sp. PhB152]ROQ60646.1 hypothetical protein EDF36_1792 [Rathayibacter sp. PhB152]ROS25667.1 hypothetical protein EDF22_2882 [Rathayibacter sp. PhB127]
MKFTGHVLSIGALLELEDEQPSSPVGRRAGVLHTAAGNARRVEQLLAEGESLETCWRFGILQTLDDYVSTAKRAGTEVASGVFSEEPGRTGAAELDAAFAALADHLAGRDGWETPAWASAAERRVEAWYPSVPSIFREEAERDSPRAFRQRGILITGRSLARA